MTFKIRTGQKISMNGEIWKIKNIRKDEYGIEGVVLLVNKQGSTFEVLKSDIQPIKTPQQMIQEVIN